MNDAASDDAPLVIFSLYVNSDVPIKALSGLAGRERAPRPDDDFFYDVAHSSFNESAWDARADKLDAIVVSALDRLDATGVEPSELRRPEVTVRAFFTFAPGAQTISVEVVARLAAYGAVIWIDALGS